MSLRFLITGGEGFIDRNLKEYLKINDHDAETIDVAGEPDHRISVTDFQRLMDIESDFDGLFHLAAVTSPPQFDTDPIGGFQVNAIGTLNVMEFARRRGIRRLVFASSSATYGNSKDTYVESNIPDRYANLYPITKIMEEHLSRYYSLRGKLNASR